MAECGFGVRTQTMHSDFNVIIYLRLREISTFQQFYVFRHHWIAHGPKSAIIVTLLRLLWSHTFSVEYQYTLEHRGWDFRKFVVKHKSLQ